MSVLDKPLLALAALFEQAARLVEHAAFDQGLYPAQWSALRYLAQQAGKHRPKVTSTVKGVADFQGTTMGPASRTVSTLVSKGLVVMADDPTDGRRKLISLTPAGRAALKSDPVLRLAEIFGRLSIDQRASLAEAIEEVIISLRSAEDPDVRRLSVKHEGATP